MTASSKRSCLCEKYENSELSRTVRVIESLESSMWVAGLKDERAGER